VNFVYREPGKIVQDVIQHELGLIDGQVMFTNQKYFIPTDGLFIVVSYIGPSKVIASNSDWVDSGTGLIERQTVAMDHWLQIDVMSFSDEARTRKEEIAMAVNSIYSEQQQEQYSMNIARDPGPFMDTSFLEETKMITRYTTSIRTKSVLRKEREIDDIFTDFSRAVPPLVTVDA
jgi:hypothetical protein